MDRHRSSGRLGGLDRHLDALAHPIAVVQNRRAMPRALRHVVVLVLASVAAATGAAPRGEQLRAPGGPRLAVVITVDGLSWDRLDSWRPWFASGLGRLLDEGAVATECRHGHLNTETAPGHASLATGAPPRLHGIAINQWYVPSGDGSRMEVVYSATQPPAAGAEGATTAIPGPGRLRLPTLGDRLVAKDARAKVVSISIKDRSAIFTAGRDPRHAVYWYRSGDGTFTTSAAYDASSSTGAAAARVVSRFNAGNAGVNIPARYGTVVDRLPLPDPVPAPGFETGLDTYQDAVVGQGFPKDLTKAKKPFSAALPWTPLADRLLADLALELIADDALALGRDEVPDLLWVSFSANDYVAHYYGPQSVEDLEILRGLDVQIGRLLDDLERRFGRDAVLVALSADHGMLPLPEAERRRDPQSGAARVDDGAIVKQLNAAVDAELRLDPSSAPVYRLEGCSLWLDRAALRRPGAPSPGRVLKIVRRELGTTWRAAIDRTIAVDAPVPKNRGDETLRRAWNALVPGRSGDLFVIPREGVLIDPYEGTGTSHGTPWDYDTHVPLVFWGGGVTARTIATPATSYDLAPTVAAWLGVSLPEAAGAPMDVREPGPHARTEDRTRTVH